MMFAARFLLLFLSLSQDFTQGQLDASVPHVGGRRVGLGVPPELPVLWDELRGLNELVLSLKAEEVDRRQALRRMESRLRDREVEAEQQGRSLDGLEETVIQQREGLRSMEVDRKLLTELNSDLRRKVEQLEEQSEARVSWLHWRLNVSESSVEELKKKSTALAAELPFLQTRLRASESTVEQLRRRNAVLAARLCNTESLMEELRMQISALTVSNSSSQSEESELETNSEVLKSVEEKRNTSAERQLLGVDLTASNSSSLQKDLSDTKSRLLQLESNTSVQTDIVKQLQVRLNSAESQIHQLQSDRTDQISELLNLQMKLNSTQSLQNNLNTELLSRLRVSEKHLEGLRRENTVLFSDQTSTLMDLQRKLNTTERLMDKIGTVQSDQFSLMESRLLDNTTAALELRLGSTETHLEQLETHTAVQSDQISLIESRLAEQHNNTTELLNRLSVSEKHLEGLMTENTVQSDQISLMESRLTEQHNNTTALELRLGSTETQLETHSAGNIDSPVLIVLIKSFIVFFFIVGSALRLRLDVTEKHLEGLRAEIAELEKQLEHLKKGNTDELKVAFSVGLTDSGPVGPFDEERTLIFSKTLTDVGHAYDRAAGVFTAPVRGVYFFSFTAADYLKGYMGLYLYRNNQPIIFNLDLNDHGGYASMSNGVALKLEEGDRVRLSLPASYRLYDDSRNFSVFSGFLLFAL
ncbi:golgin subfamily A member 3-like isoform X3 [Anabas testudineus]|uniref:golgin subfamily A member 3-like isoform X3 n=1 Tax=Anabas testudineus TaxID=64144 RepID=UPI000E45C66E|nr:golgin subfamily A member 3-like isoform X3 [Anabas testudineus]